MEKEKKVLFVLSSHARFDSTGEATGWWLSEASHPWKELHESNIKIEFVSPKGGKAPVTGVDMSDSVNKEFLGNTFVLDQIAHTSTPDQIHVHDYVAIHFVGGHGACFDFPDNLALSQLAADFYDNGKIVSAVCHGPSGLLNVKLWDGSFLLKDKKVTGFSDLEELEIKKIYDVPFLLQSEMMLRGGIFQLKPNWSDHVVIDGRLITGQNPQSARSLGRELVKMIQALK
ncbi:MAG: type 1 glutamine amidotransferase domain-containing protein [Bacteroidales bacterium]